MSFSRNPRLRLAAALLPVALFAAPSFAIVITPVADYQLQQVFTSSVAGPPPLTEVNTGTATGGSFVQANVNGNTQLVYSFSGGTAGGEGLAAATSGVISPATYSVVVDAEISTIASTISKLIDFKSLGSDAGLYAVAGIPTFYNATVPVATGTTPLVSGTFAELALTHDASGTVSLYLNGTQDFTFDDSTSQLATLSTNALNFFVDDPNTLTIPAGLTLENASGQAARIRLFDAALTPSQVAALAPEPTSLGLLALGSAALITRRQKQRG